MSRVTSRIRILSLAAVLPLLLSALPMAAANAESLPDLTDPSSTMERYAPERVAPDSQTTKLVASSESGSADPGSPGEQTSISVEDSGTDTDLSISPPDETSYAGADAQYQVFTNDDATFATYMKAVPGGSQTIFAALHEAALSSLTVTLSSPVVQQVDDGAGVKLLTLANDQTIALYAPWAQDASGSALPTSYTIAGSTITQTVSTNSETTFPVIADPAWSYVRTFSTGATTPAKARALLQSCFNCRFPVAGAPKAFPRSGQDLPLYVGPTRGLSLNFHCVFLSEFSSSGQGQSSWGFRFKAAEGHVDGIGSTVNFTITNSRGANSMAVYGYIVNDVIAGLARNVYVDKAAATWADFAARLRKG